MARRRTGGHGAAVADSIYCPANFGHINNAWISTRALSVPVGRIPRSAREAAMEWRKHAWKNVGAICAMLALTPMPDSSDGAADALCLPGGK
jgi:hypothetical protein